jgi:hypothetical protein
VLGRGGSGLGPRRGQRGLAQRTKAPVLGRAGVTQRMNSRWLKQEVTWIREGEAGSRRAEDELTMEDELVVERVIETRT